MIFSWFLHLICKRDGPSFMSIFRQYTHEMLVIALFIIILNINKEEEKGENIDKYS